MLMLIDPVRRRRASANMSEAHGVSIDIHGTAGEYSPFLIQSKDPYGNPRQDSSDDKFNFYIEKDAIAADAHGVLHTGITYFKGSYDDHASGEDGKLYLFCVL